MRTRSPRPSGPIVVAAALAGVLIAATVFGPYGWFIDEFYYLACARHLSWGYVDHPPLSVFILAATRSVLGESMTAVRLPVALAAAATVLVTGRIARRLGGGRRAGWIAALAVATSPMTFVMGSFFSMNAFELLLWPLMGLVLLRLLDENQPRLWLVVGLLLGLAVLNKHTSVIFGAAMIAGVLCTPARRHLMTPWPWLGALAAIAIIAPNMLWQWSNGWPSVEFYANAQMGKNISTPPLQAFLSQVLFEGPGSLPVWLAGAVFLIRAPRERSWRALGVAFVLLFAMMIFSGSSRPDRIGACYPIVLAAGAVAIERAAEKRGRAWFAPAAVALLLVSGLVVAPVTLPVVPPAKAALYTRAIGLLPPLERGKTSPLPQWLADRTGWESFVDNVADLYRRLPPEDQKRAVIFTPDYGHAGALELLGPSRGIHARVISNHNTYWIWGRGLPDPQVMIAVGANQSDLEFLFEQVELDRRDYCDFCMSWRNNMPIYVARIPRRSLAPVWERRKSFG